MKSYYIVNFFSPILNDVGELVQAIKKARMSQEYIDLNNNI